MICCVITAPFFKQAFNDMLHVRSAAEMIEIRLDYIKDLNEDHIKEFIDKKPLPLIFTCRSKSDGGLFNGTLKSQISILKKCIELGADYIDIEHSIDKTEIKNLIKIKDKTKVILSYHNFTKIPKDIEKISSNLFLLGSDIVKIACKANSINDNLIMFNLLSKFKKSDQKMIGICIGKYGEMSRILNLKFGSLLTYGFLKKGKESALGQISCEFLKRLYRVHKIDNKTKIFGLVGNPVSESRGFIVHNLAFKENKINAVYLNLLVDDLKSFLINFKNFFSGLSITMPFKQDIVIYLDDIDPIAKKMGVVNTITLKSNKMVGYNTDASGAIKAIEEKLSLINKNIVILGAGASAKAISYLLKEKANKLIIVNRTIEKGEALAKELSSPFIKLSEIQKINWNDIDLLINATSIGMTPKYNVSPIPQKFLRNMVVFDVVYNPLITKLLKDAEYNRCQTIPGIKMFINQATIQFKLWTGINVDKNLMENNVLGYVTE